MVKTKIVKTTEKYDKDGKLVEKTTREETTEDDTVYTSSTPWYGTGKIYDPYCTTTASNANDRFGNPVDSKGV